MIRGLLAAALCAPLLSACVVYADDAAHDIQIVVPARTPQEGTVEVLRGVRFENGQMVIRVDSNGCTRAEDFILVDRGPDIVSDDALSTLTVLRARPDLCKALVPEGVEINIHAAAAGDIFALGNPLKP